MEQQTGSKLGKEYIKAVYLFNFYAEYIMWNAELDEAQSGIKITRRNINKPRCANDTTLMAQSEENLMSLLRKGKEESEKAGLELNIQKTKIMTSGPITSWQIDGETMEIVTDFILGASKSLQTVNEAMNKRHLLLGRKDMTNLAHQTAETLLRQQRSS